MSRATTSAVRKFQLLPPTWRTMVIAGAREFTGQAIVPETGRRTKVVDLIYQDAETGVQIHKNYSLDRPSYLRSVLEAIAPGKSDELLSEIDWASDDVDQLFGVEINVKVFHEEYPVNSGNQQNRIGAVLPLEPEQHSMNNDDEEDDAPAF